MKKLLLLLGIFMLMAHLSYAQDCSETFSGDGTYYGYAGGGNCSFANPDLPAMTGAMNEEQYATSNMCGACVNVTGANGSLTIRIEDRCPECAYGDIDLSEDAFPYIDDKINGRVDISWQIVACPVDGPIEFYFKEGSSQWWTAVQIRNHKYPIASLEYKVDGEYVTMEREMYNYFLVASGMGTGPYDFRVTDMYGNVIEETDIPLVLTTEISGVNQFPDCDDDGSFTDIDVTGVSVSPTTVSLSTIGQTGTLSASVLPTDATNQSVSWTSSNTSVATVSSSGVVTAVSNGSATMTVTTSDGGYVASSSVGVDAGSDVSVTGVSVSPTSVSLTAIGQTSALTATVSPSDATNQSVSWNSNNTGVATVNSSGVVTAVSSGTATITVTTEDGSYTASCVISVDVDDNSDVSVTGVSISTSSFTLTSSGSTKTITATVLPTSATNQSVSWSSSSTSVATVNSNGIVTAVSDGTATITVTTEDGGYMATCVVTVSISTTSDCDNPEEISSSYSYDGAGDYCWIVASEPGYVSSWNLEELTINGVEYSNMWSSNMPDAQDGEWLIQYTGNYAWSHFEIGQLKTADGITIPMSQNKLYPNPASKTVWLNSDVDITKATLFSADGKLIKTIQVNSKQMELDVKDVEKGIYLIKIEMGKDIETKTLMIK